MNDIVSNVLTILALFLVVIFLGLTHRKAGYSPGKSLVWAIAYCIPGINVVAYLYFLTTEWPIERELRELRGLAGRGTEKDAAVIYEEAVKLQAKGRVVEALRRYEDVVARYPRTTASRDAERSVSFLKNRGDTP
jgi:hypothetical protein